MITAGGYTTENAVPAIEPAPAHPGWGAAERLRPFEGLWRRRTRLTHVLLIWLHWRKAKLADAVAFGRMFIANPESRRAIFCDDRRVLSVQPRQPFPVTWLGPLSSPRPWRPADAAEGGPSVMLRFDLPDGRVVLAEIAARLYVMTARMIGARYSIED